MKEKLKQNISTLIFSLLIFMGLALYRATLYEPNEIKFNINYFIDSKDKIKLSEAMKIFQIPHKVNNAERSLINFGFNTQTMWCGIYTDNSIKQKVIRIENAHLDTVNFYAIDANGEIIKQVFTGDARTFDSRDIIDNMFVFSVPENTDKVFLKVKTSGSLLVPIKYYKSDEYFKEAGNFSQFLWIYFGVTFFSLISSFIFYQNLRESLFIYNAIFTFSILIYTLTDFGKLFQILWPSFPIVNQYVSFIYLGSTLVMVIFSSRFLDVTKNSSWFKYTLIVIYLSFAFFFILSALGQYALVFSYLQYIDLIIIIYNLTAAIYLLLSGKAGGIKLFIFSWLSFIFCTFIYFFGIKGLIPFDHPLVFNAIQIGAIAQVMLLFASVSDKILGIKREKEKSDDRLIKLLEENNRLVSEQNTLLEAKVTERTKVLQEKSQQIEAQNTELLQQREELSALSEILLSQNQLIEKQNNDLKENKVLLEKEVLERTRELQEANFMLTAKNEKLEQFSFIVSHNLRGPVSATLGVIDLMEYLDLENPGFKDLLGKLKLSVFRVDNIVKDLAVYLDYYYSTQLNKEDINLKTVLKDISENLSLFTANQYQIEGDIEVERIRSIPTYIYSIFSNTFFLADRYALATGHSVSVKVRNALNNTFEIIFIFNARPLWTTIEINRIYKLENLVEFEKGQKDFNLLIIQTQVALLHGSAYYQCKEGATEIRILLPIQ